MTKPPDVRTALATLAPAQVRDLLAGLSADELLTLRYDWDTWARPEQLPPDDDPSWTLFFFSAGRGAGKSRSGAEWIRKMVREHPGCRVALVARTAADARDTMIEGEAGILAVHPPSARPLYEPSKRRLTWRDGSQATAFSADEADQLRGPSHHFAWADELCAWPDLDAVWANLMMGMRLGARPRVFVSTTPRPSRLLRSLLAAPTTIVRRGSTYDNAANLPASALAEFRARYEGTRLGRQELHAELLDDVAGALWSRETLDETRVPTAPADLVRIVIGVDPAISAHEGSDLTGIVAVARGANGHLYVLADRSCRASPAVWAARAVALFDELGADRVVAEANQGGQMVEATLRTVRPTLPVTLTHATRGKVTRGEPVAALWEQGRAHIVGSQPDLEEELCSFAPGLMDHSPDRADAMCWAATSLLGYRSDLEWLRKITTRDGGEGPCAQVGNRIRLPWR